MPAIAVVAFSGTGTTLRLAEAVTEGAGPGAVLMPIRGAQIVEGRFKDDAFLAALDGMDAIVYGAATYMGGPAAPFKAFADATGGRWFQRTWSGKVAGGFTASGSPSGDKQVTLQYLQTLAMQHGQVWVGQDAIAGWMLGQPQDTAINFLGSHGGVMARQANDKGGVISPGDTATAKAYGARIAAITAKLRG